MVEHRQMEHQHTGAFIHKPDSPANVGGYGIDGFGDAAVGLCQQEAGEEGIGSEQALTGCGWLRLMLCQCPGGKRN